MKEKEFKAALIRCALCGDKKTRIKYASELADEYNKVTSYLLDRLAYAAKELEENKLNLSCMVLAMGSQRDEILDRVNAMKEILEYKKEK